MACEKLHALRAFRERYRSSELLICGVQDGTDGLSGWQLPTNVWAIMFLTEVVPILRSSRIVCVSKETGEIVYDGWLCDDG